MAEAHRFSNINENSVHQMILYCVFASRVYQAKTWRTKLAVTACWTPNFEGIGNILATSKTMEIEARLRCASKNLKSKPVRTKPWCFAAIHARSRRVTEEFRTNPPRRKPTRQLAQPKTFCVVRNNVQTKDTLGPPALQEGVRERLTTQAAAGLKTEPGEIKNEPSSALFESKTF